MLLTSNSSMWKYLAICLIGVLGIVIGNLVWLDVLMAVTMKMAVFWVVTSCRLVWVYQCFRVLYCLHHQGDDSSSWWWRQYKMSELLVNLYQSTW
jgi:hypothetical protein